MCATRVLAQAPLVRAGLSLAVALLAPTASARAQTPEPPAFPLDSIEVVRILQDAAAAFGEASESVRANDRLRRHLQALFHAWGAEWDAEPVPRPSTPERAVDSLIARGEVHEAIARARDQPPYFSIRVIRALSASGRIDQALALSDSTGLTTHGVSSVLESAPDSLDWRWRVARVERFLLDESRDTASVSTNRGVLNRYLAEHDFVRAWALAGTWELDSLTAWRLDILDLAYEQNLAGADSLFLDTYERVQGISDPEVRDRQLEWLSALCQQANAPPCDGPELGHHLRVRRAPHLLEEALAAGRFDEADSLDREVRTLVPPLDHAFVVARGLERAHYPCVREARCGRTYDSLLTAVLPELDRVATGQSGPTKDELNVHIAALWAGRETSRAWAAIDRIESPGARSRGLRSLVLASWPWDPENALRALRESEGAGGVPYVQSDYLRFMAWGDTERAESVLGLIDSGVSRMRARLAWAARVQDSGRWEAARRLAVAALDEWDPSAEPLIGSRGQFNFFWRGGIYNDVVAWARSRQDPDDRAAALAAVIGALPRP